MMILENFKQKDSIIKEIGKEYKKTKFFCSGAYFICEEESIYLRENKSIQYYKELKDKVDYILMQLDEELAKVIFNEYLSKKVDNWWMYYYSKSTFYRLKNKAMNHFLEWWYV